MKTLQPTSILFFVFIFFTLTLSAQDSSRMIIISKNVGETIDQFEREHYHLFPPVKNFVSARFFIAPDSTYFAQIEILGDNGASVLTRVDYSNVTLFMLAEKINHYDDLIAGNYVMGQDPAKIQVIEGSEISWNPPPVKIAEKATLLETSPSILSTTGNPSSFELRISGGYGFPKGGYPLTDEDIVSTSSGSTSSYARTNVNDKYFSIGEGIRFEADFIYYVKENVGVFIQAGYSWGKKSSKFTYTSNNTYPPNPPTWSSSTHEQTLNFSVIPLVAGLHFKTSIGNVQPYIGAGAGPMFQNNLTIENKSSYRNSYVDAISTVEQNLNLTSEVPIAYVGYVGCNIPINPKAAFFVQLKASMVSVYITRTELTKYVADGVDRLQSLTTYDKITEYEADKNYTTTGSVDTSKPSFGGAPEPLDANSIGLTAGISIGF